MPTAVNMKLCRRVALSAGVVLLAVALLGQGPCGTEPPPPDAVGICTEHYSAMWAKGREATRQDCFDNCSATVQCSWSYTPPVES